MKNLKKEEIENLSYKDITYMILNNEKNGLNTLDLFTVIVNSLELPSRIIDDKIGDYYTSLLTDKRFIMIDGLWDLRIRHTSDKIIMDALEDDDNDLEDIKEDEDGLPIEDDYNDEDYSSNAAVDGEFDDSEEDDLKDLIIIDEDELEEE